MPTTKEAVTTMTDFVNNFSHDNKEFCELMSREHRYLQEEFRISKEKFNKDFCMNSAN